MEMIHINEVFSLHTCTRPQFCYSTRFIHYRIPSTRTNAIVPYKSLQTAAGDIRCQWQKKFQTGQKKPQPTGLKLRVHNIHVYQRRLLSLKSGIGIVQWFCKAVAPSLWVGMSRGGEDKQSGTLHCTCKVLLDYDCETQRWRGESWRQP